MEYAQPNLLCKHCQASRYTIPSTQNHIQGSITELKTSIIELFNKVKLNQMKARLTKLLHKYLVKAVNNELIMKLLENYNYNHTSDTTSLLSLMGIDEILTDRRALSSSAFLIQ